MKQLKAVVAIVIMGSLTAGCISEFEKLDSFKHPRWEPQFAVPVIDESLTLKDIVASKVSEGNLTTDQSGKYIFTYYADFVSQSAGDAIQLPDQSAFLVIPSPGTAPSQTNYQFSHYYDLSLSGGKELTIADLKSGNVSVALASTFKQSIGVTLEFPTISKSESILATPEIILSKSTGTPTTASADIDLSAYRMLLNTISAQPYNRLPFIVKVRFIGSTSEVLATDYLNVDFKISNMGYSYLEGFLGDFSLASSQADTIDLNLFSNHVEDGSVVLTDPQFQTGYKNSFGIAVKGSIVKPRVILKDNSILYLEGSGVDSINNTVINPATEQQKVAVTNLVMLTRENTTNIVKVFEPTPKKLVYDFSLSSVKGTDPQANRTQFAYDTSSISLSGFIRFSAEGRIVSYAVTDTFDLQLPGSESQEVKEILMRMVVSNGFPLDMDIKAIVLDSNNNKIDSLVPVDNKNARLIAAASVIDANGRVDQQSPTVSARDFIMTRERYKIMQEKGKKLLIQARMNTTNASSGQNVSIYDDYKIRFQLGAQVKVSIDLNN
jgi:hypothetical protein